MHVRLRKPISIWHYFIFWCFTQQISTLAGNQVPSYFVWEVLFTMAIIGIGLLLFALLIGNMQNFLQALGRRSSKYFDCTIKIIRFYTTMCRFDFLNMLLCSMFVLTKEKLLFVLCRRLELSLRRRDVEQWMRHRRLPENLRRWHINWL